MDVAEIQQIIRQGNKAVSQREYRGALKEYSVAATQLGLASVLQADQSTSATLERLMSRTACNAALAAMYMKDHQLAVTNANHALKHIPSADPPYLLLATQRFLEAAAVRCKLVKVEEIEAWITGGELQALDQGPQRAASGMSQGSSGGRFSSGGHTGMGGGSSSGAGSSSGGSSEGSSSRNSSSGGSSGSATSYASTTTYTSVHSPRTGACSAANLYNSTASSSLVSAPAAASAALPHLPARGSGMQHRAPASVSPHPPCPNPAGGLWGPPLSPCPPQDVIGKEQQTWSRLAAVDSLPVLNTLNQLLSWSLRDCSSQQEQQPAAPAPSAVPVHPRTSHLQAWPAGIPVSYAAPLTNPAVRAWLRASRRLQSLRKVVEAAVESSEGGGDTDVVTIDLLDGSGNARSLAELVHQINDGKYPGIERYYLSFTPCESVIFTTKALLILLVADEDDSLVEALGATGSLHINGPVTIRGIPRSAVGHTRLVLPTRLGGPHAITVHYRLLAQTVAFAGVSCTCVNQRTQAASNHGSLGPAALGHWRLQSLPMSERPPPAHQQAGRSYRPGCTAGIGGTTRVYGASLGAAGSRATVRPEVVSLADLAQGALGGLIRVQVQAPVMLGDGPDLGGTEFTSCRFSPACECRDCMVPGAAVYIAGHASTVALFGCQVERCLAGVVCATPTRTGKAVAAGTQFTQCGAGVLVAQGEASILTPSALKSMCHRALQREGTSTRERAAGNLERLTGSARSSFRDCLCAVCAYGEGDDPVRRAALQLCKAGSQADSSVVCRGVDISGCGNKAGCLLDSVDAPPVYLGNLSVTAAVHHSALSLWDCIITDCRGTPAVGTWGTNSTVGLYGTSITGCDAGLHIRQGGKLACGGRSACIGSLHYGLHLEGESRPLKEDHLLEAADEGNQESPQQKVLVIQGSRLHDVHIPTKEKQHLENLGRKSVIQAGTYSVGTIHCRSLQEVDEVFGLPK